MYRKPDESKVKFVPSMFNLMLIQVIDEANHEFKLIKSAFSSHFKLAMVYDADNGKTLP